MEKMNLKQKAYMIIRERIENCQYEPSSFLNEDILCRDLEMSRTPVREAFIRLQRDGLVEIYPQKETVVSRIDFAKVEQERFVRESLECANIDLLLERCSRDDINRLELNLEQQHATVSSCDYNALHRLDNSFHEYLFRITGQLFAWTIIENTSNHYARIRMMTVWDKDIMQEIVLQHQKILSAVQDGSADYAKIYIKTHLHQLEDQLQQLLKDYPDYFVSDSVPATKRFEALLAQ